jgi:transcriptional regulator with XRE-family HTH domain
MNIGTQLKETRKSLNLTQKQLQEKSKISFVTINRIEGGSNPRLNVLNKLFNSMGKQVNLTLTDQNEANVLG